MFAHLNHIAPIFGIFMHCIPLSWTGSPCNLLFLNLGLYGLVQATVGVGTVLIWDFCVAYTRGGGTQSDKCLVHDESSRDFKVDNVTLSMLPQPSNCISRTLLQPAKCSAKVVSTSGAAIGCKCSCFSKAMT